MTTIYVAFVISALLLSVVAYGSRVHVAIKAVAFSSLVLLGVFTEGYYRDQLGAPIRHYPQGEFMYIHHIIVGDEIRLWIWTDERGDRLYVLPYDQETAEELKEAKEQTEGGNTQQGEFVTEDDGGKPQPPSLQTDNWKGDLDDHRKEST
jgi:hypothetical protein